MAIDSGASQNNKIDASSASAEAEEQRKNLSNKRIFWAVIAFCIIAAVFLGIEIAEIIANLF